MFAKISWVSFFTFFIFSISLHSQDVIKLQNPSFEDIPRRGGDYYLPIKGWHDCGLTLFDGETPPDIHPVPGSAWEVTKFPYDGLTFLGMVVRYNDTWESLSQALSSPISAGSCYSFTAFIARSDLYKSHTTRSDSVENFVRPAVFKIWGGNSFCQKSELLGESPAVTNTEWKQYKFLFQPKKSHKYITIEAFYKTPILEAYNGHILVDNLSDIVKVECPMFPNDLVAKVSDPPSKLPANPSTPVTSPKPKPGPTKSTNKETPGATVPFKAVLLPELGGQKLYVGQKIRLNHLYFQMDSVNLLPNSHKVLDELVSYLKANPKTKIEIGGHTNTIPPDSYCNQLSTARAKSVHDYLVSKGIPEYRLEYKGYGKTDPLIRNDKYNKEAKYKNQRVEIKILAVS